MRNVVISALAQPRHDNVWMLVWPLFVIGIVQYLLNPTAPRLQHRLHTERPQPSSRFQLRVRVCANSPVVHWHTLAQPSSLVSGVISNSRHVGIVLPIFR